MLTTDPSISPSRRSEAQNDLRLQSVAWRVLLRGLDRLDTEALDDQQRLAVAALAEMLADALGAITAGG